MDRGHPSRHEMVASAGATLRWVLLRCDCESANSLGARHSPRLVRWNRGWPLKWWSLRRDRNCRNRWHLKNRKSVSWCCEAVNFQLCGMYRPNRSASSRDLLFQWLVGSVSSAFDATFEKSVALAILTLFQGFLDQVVNCWFSFCSDKTK